MATENNLDMQSFDDNDVIAFKDGTVKLVRLRRALDVALSSKLPDALVDSLTTQKLLLNADRYFRESRAWGSRDDGWFREGVECEILQLGESHWRKGKLRLRVVVEFVAEEELESLETPILQEAHHPELAQGHDFRNGNGKSDSLLNHR